MRSTPSRSESDDLFLRNRRNVENRCKYRHGIRNLFSCRSLRIPRSHMFFFRIPYICEYGGLQGVPDGGNPKITIRRACDFTILDSLLS